MKFSIQFCYNIHLHLSIIYLLYILTLSLKKKKKKKKEYFLTFEIFLSYRWTNSADVVRARCTMCRVTYTVRAGGARISSCSGTTATQDSVLEFSRQRRGY